MRVEAESNAATSSIFMARSVALLAQARRLRTSGRDARVPGARASRPLDRRRPAGAYGLPHLREPARLRFHQRVFALNPVPLIEPALPDHPHHLLGMIFRALDP